MYLFKVDAHTDVGDKKETNQDSIFSKFDTVNGHSVGLFIVADGCGGLAYGEEISNLVVTYFSRVWSNELKMLLYQKIIVSNDIDDLLENAIMEINNSAKSFGSQVNSKVGSTLSLLLIIDKRYYIKNIGDSRVYLVRKNKIIKLTEDQSLVADMIRNGELTKEEAKTFKRKNVLTMCIGIFDTVYTYSKNGKLKKNDKFLICCDGVHNCVDEPDMLRIVKQKNESNKAENIRNAIPKGKANDNVSSIVVSINETRKTIIKRRVKQAVLLLILLLVLLFWHPTYHVMIEIRHIYDMYWSETCNICGERLGQDYLPNRPIY